MGKGTHFFGQPVYGQLIKSLERWHQSAHRHISKRERALRCQVHLRGTI